MVSVYGSVNAMTGGRYDMAGWRENFETRRNRAWWIFRRPNLLVMAIDWLTMGAHTFREDATNPVDTRRHE